MPTATKGRVAPVPLLFRCTARSAVGTSCGCSCARSTARQVAGLIRRTCAGVHRANRLRARLHGQVNVGSLPCGEFTAH